MCINYDSGRQSYCNNVKAYFFGPSCIYVDFFVIFYFVNFSLVPTVQHTKLATRKLLKRVRQYF